LLCNLIYEAMLRVLQLDLARGLRGLIGVLETKADTADVCLVKKRARVDLDGDRPGTLFNRGINLFGRPDQDGADSGAPVVKE
jgi:hypothetical protein